MIALLNISHFSVLLGTEKEDKKKSILRSLLLEEEEKLARLTQKAPRSQNNLPAVNRPAPMRSEPVQDWRLGAALANMPHGLCLFDAKRRIVLCNTRYSEMYSLPQHLLVAGTSLESIISYRQRIGNAPVDFPNYASHDGIEFKQGDNTIFEFVLEDGRTIRVKHLALKGGGYVAMHEDITDSLQSKENFQSIFNAVGEGIFILDAATGIFIEVNEPGALLLGYAAGELIGRSVQTVSSGVPPHNDRAVLEWITRAGASGQPERFAWQSKSKDGRIFPTEIAIRFASIGMTSVVVSARGEATCAWPPAERVETGRHASG